MHSMWAKGSPTTWSTKRYTSSVDAYRYYIQGRAYAQRRTPADFQRAVGLYQQAIAQDGRYALAYAGLADAYLLLAARGFLPLAEGRRNARQAAATARTSSAAITPVR